MIIPVRSGPVIVKAVSLSWDWTRLQPQRAYWVRDCLYLYWCYNRPTRKRGPWNSVKNRYLQFLPVQNLLDILAEGEHCYWTTQGVAAAL